VDDNHAIISSSVGPEYYVNIMSFVDKDQLEPGSSLLTHYKVNSIVGILADEADPMVSVMKVDKAPLESYADIGGLETQIQEMKEAVELPLTHPELYEDIGIRPPKGVRSVFLSFFKKIRRHAPFSPDVAPRFPHMSEINSLFPFLHR
jgi:26S proteasome regulatory subunit T2